MVYDVMPCMMSLSLLKELCIPSEVVRSAVKTEGTVRILMVSLEVHLLRGGR